MSMMPKLSKVPMVGPYLNLWDQEKKWVEAHMELDGEDGIIIQVKKIIVSQRNVNQIKYSYSYGPSLTYGY